MALANSGTYGYALGGQPVLNPLHQMEHIISRLSSGVQLRWAHRPQVYVPTCTNAESCNIYL